MMRLRSGRRTVLALLSLLAQAAHCHALRPPAPPQVQAESAVVMDADTGAVLWCRNPDEKMFPASTTKIMTAMLLIEMRQPTDVLVAPPGLDAVPESSMHLRPGEQVTVRNLLYALLLRSANDAAVGVAIDLGGTMQGFADLMNKRAAELGCRHTHFANPNGLHDPNHWTCARDLALIARRAMSYPLFESTVRTQKVKISRSMNQRDLWMVNRNKWLRKDPTADGVKTGFTNEAGHTYVGSATRDGFRVITVVLKSGNWQSDNQALLDWAFANFGHETVASPNQPIGTLEVKGGAKTQVQVGVASPVQAVVAKGAVPAPVTIVAPHSLKAPIAAGQIVGAALFYGPDGEHSSTPLVAFSAVPEIPPSSKAPSFWIGGGLLALGTVLMRRKSRRQRPNGLRPKPQARRPQIRVGSGR